MMMVMLTIFMVGFKEGGVGADCGGDGGGGDRMMIVMILRMKQGILQALSASGAHPVGYFHPLQETVKWAKFWHKMGKF